MLQTPRILVLSISGKFQPKPLLVTPAYEGGAQLSPDGRWMVYQSNETGQPEIYVRRYPALESSRNPGAESNLLILRRRGCITSKIDPKNIGLCAADASALCENLWRSP